MGFIYPALDQVINHAGRLRNRSRGRLSCPIVFRSPMGAGIHAPTARFKSKVGEINSGWVTTFSEYSIISENRMTKVPDDFDPEVGALMGCAVTTAMGVINNDARLGIGQSIAVFGTGGVGLNIVQFAAMVAAHPIIAIDLQDHKLDLARKLGATHAINAGRQEVAAEILKIVGSTGVDVAVENTGVADVIETAYAVTGAAGRTILVGVPTKSARHPSFYTLPLHFDKVLTGSHGGDCRPDVDIPKLVRLYEAGKLKFDGLVSRRYPLAQTREALTYLAFQTIGALMAMVSAPLYFATLAIHYVEYHVLMFPRCFHTGLNEDRGLDRWFGTLRKHRAVFYGIVIAAAGVVMVIMLMQSNPTSAFRANPMRYLAIVSIFDGLFVFHYFVEMLIWRFSDPYFRRTLSPLYFTPRARAAA
jgi:S-(hydroxymethyl)glutathione dehydrogenase/alcohol dehydrogenase